MAARQSRPPRQALPDVGILDEAVAERILAAMRTASAMLSAAGIRHALIGGLAVGAHGYPRATRDVDFVVGEEAFVRHDGGIVTIAAGVPIAVGDVQIDTLNVDPAEDFLMDALIHAPKTDGIPVLPIGALIYMKLKASRQKDLGDVTELIKQGLMPVEDVREYLLVHASHMVAKFDRLVDRSDRD